MRLLAVLAVLTISTAGLVVSASPAAEAKAAGQVVSKSLVQAVRGLPVAAETRAGYDRAKFRLWIDADRDCRDTRDEVLATESLIRVRGCNIQRGKWRSYYDGVVTRDSSTFDIDHLVPLAEAWDSGARRWNAATRERYANDLGDPRTLVAVTAAANRSKSDQDHGRMAPAARAVSLRPAVGGGQDPLGPHHRHRREASAHNARQALPGHDHHRAPGWHHQRHHISLLGEHHFRRGDRIHVLERHGSAVRLLLPGHRRRLRPLHPRPRPRVRLVHRQRR